MSPPNPPSRKKRRLADQKNRVVRRPPTKSKKLWGLLNLPVDVIFEIFSQLDIYDLLLLARLNKALRSLLMHRSSMSVWKTARANDRDIPDVPRGMCEPSYARLLFDRHCHYCGVKGARVIQWRLRLRLCNTCVKLHMVKLRNEEPNPFDGLDWDDPEHRQLLLLTIIPMRRTNTHFIYLQKDYQEAESKFLSIADSVARTAFLEEKTIEMSELDQEALMYEDWLVKRNARRRQSLAIVQGRRVATIQAKLSAFGYDVEDPIFESVWNTNLAKQPVPLTARIWKRIKPQIVAQMERVQERARHRKEKIEFEGSKMYALAVWRRFQKSRYLNSQEIPSNLHEMSAVVQNILKTRPASAEFDAESSVDQGEVLLNGLFDEWRNYLQNHLLSHMSHPSSMFNRPSSTINDSGRDSGLRRLALATSVFTCECSQPEVITVDHNGQWGVNTFAIKPLFYPQVLGHICLARAPTMMRHAMTTLAVLLEAFAFSYRSPGGPHFWDCSRVVLNLELGDIVLRLVQAAGLDPGTTTVQDMDDLDVYFACMSCAVQDPQEIQVYDTQAFRWKEALRHEHMHHAPNHDDVSWLVLTAAQVEEGRQDERKIRTNRRWACAKCAPALLPFDSWEMYLQEIHQEYVHKNDAPELDVDYFEDVASPHCGYQPLPQSVSIAF
ncbi:hypothetical protein C8R46DRAFT_1191279, partial [Mycena filopes]